MHVRWTRELWQALRPYATGGVYANHIGRKEEDGTDQVWTPTVPTTSVWRSCSRYDPTDLSRHNQNITSAV